jgi:4-hydroxybenzoate polyprenyltransferase
MVTAIGYGMLMFIVGWGVYKPIFTVPIWILIFLYLHEVVVGMAKDFSDVEGDQKEGVKTIPVIFGKKRGAEICFGLYLIPFVFLLSLQTFNYLSTSFIILFVAGLFFGLLIFGFNSFEDKKYNYLGYFFWIIGAVVIRLILFDAYIQLN